MKLAPREVPRWLAKPLTVAAILVHGEDRGSVTDLAGQIAEAIVPDLRDPFSVALLEADHLKSDPARLQDEMSALSPLGGPKLIRLREAADRHTTIIEACLPSPGDTRGKNILLIEAGDLTFRSSLRKLFEGHSAAAGIHCGSEIIADIEGFITQTLRGEGLSIEPEALSALSARLGADRALLRRALESLALYRGADRAQPVTVTDVMATTGDAAQLGLDAVMDAIMTGSRPAIDRALTKAFESGATPVGILRAALRLMQRIQMVSAMMEQGSSADTALGGLFPPLPYPARGPFLAACRSWPRDAAGRALGLLSEAEARCKTTGLPESVICVDALLRLPGLARAALKRA